MQSRTNTYWFITFHVRKVTADGAVERFSNEAIEMHPVDWIYKVNTSNTESITLIQALPIDEKRYTFLQRAEFMKKGTRSIKRPMKRPFDIARQG